MPEKRPDRPWRLVTSHALVLVCLRQDPTMRQRDIAARTGLTDRTVKSVIDDLIKDGSIERTRVGRRNTYKVNVEQPLPHELIQDHALGEFLDAVAAPKDESSSAKGSASEADAEVVACEDAAEVYETFFRMCSDGALMATADGELLAVNPAACEILRGTERQICSAGRDGLVDPDDPQIIAALEERAQQGETQRTVTMRRCDGSTFQARVRAVLFTTRSGEQRACSTFREVGAAAG